MEEVSVPTHPKRGPPELDLDHHLEAMNQQVDVISHLTKHATKYRWIPSWWMLRDAKVAAASLIRLLDNVLDVAESEKGIDKFDFFPRPNKHEKVEQE